MFDTFGEFDCYSEINMLAESLKEEGDIDSLRLLAEENGLQDYVEDYICERCDELCDPVTAAIGKMEVEYGQATSYKELAKDVKDYLESNCDDLDFAMEIRKRGKKMEGCAIEILKKMRQSARYVSVGNISCHYCGPTQMYQIIREYYGIGVRK